MLVDTHSHIHFAQFREELDAVLDRAAAAGVTKQLIVGVNDLDSAEAIGVAKAFENLWATVGLHPHDADRGIEALDAIADLARHQIVRGIGECGLDLYKSETTLDDQERALRYQIELGLELNLPMVFHVREAFPDFWRILEDYPDVRGLVHCFSAGEAEVTAALERGLYIALGGIMTFTKDPKQLAAAKLVPLDKLVLETDSPFLAPPPHRGQQNEPAFLADTAAFLAELRGESVQNLTAATTASAERLFNI